MCGVETWLSGVNSRSVKGYRGSHICGDMNIYLPSVHKSEAKSI
jgi:hypothetical protein